MADTTVHAPVARRPAPMTQGTTLGRKALQWRLLLQLVVPQEWRRGRFLNSPTSSRRRPWPDRRAYHDRGWLTGNLVSFIPEEDVPTVEGSTIVCFESQLAAGVGLPPSKFLSSIMNYLGCSLVHLNSNAVSALSSFVMLCECWLRIPPDTNLF
jgi:hypothetical protein